MPLTPGRVHTYLKHCSGCERERPTSNAINEYIPSGLGFASCMAFGKSQKPHLRFQLSPRVVVTLEGKIDDITYKTVSISRDLRVSASVRFALPIHVLLVYK